MKGIFSVCLFMTIFSIVAWADIPPIKTPPPTPPPVSKSIDSGLKIQLDKSAKDVKLIIPKDQIRQLRAQLDEIDGQPETTAALSLSFSRTQTIVSGLFMSLAVIFAGVWLMRSRKISVRAAAGIGVLFLSGTAIVASANVPPGQYPNNINDHVFSDEFRRYQGGYTPLKVVVSGNSDRDFKLIVPRIKNDSEEE